MALAKRLLIVEDEEPILKGLSDVFVFHGYRVDVARDGRRGLELALSGEFDLVILDVMLPEMDGFTVCNRIREKNRELAVIILTAKTADEDIVNGFTLGADDYVTKPFSVRELVLRVEAVLRRGLPNEPTMDRVLEVAGLKIDLATLRGSPLDRSDGRGELLFTRREVEMLSYLKANQDRPVSRGELLTKIWGYRKASTIETRTVDIHIAKLRRKIEQDPRAPRFLLTIRAEGYRLANAGERDG